MPAKKKVEAEVKVETKERKIKILCKRSIWVGKEGEKAKKIPRDTVMLLTAAEVKHFGSAVTRDLPDDEEEEQSWAMN